MWMDERSVSRRAEEQQRPRAVKRPSYSAAERLPRRTACRFRALAGNLRRIFSLYRRNRTRETGKMNKLNRIMTAVALAATTATSVAVPADARHRHHYYGRTYYLHK